MDLSKINKHLDAVSQDLQQISSSLQKGKDYKKFSTDASSHLKALRTALKGQVPQNVMDNLYQASVNLTNMTKAKSKDASILQKQVQAPFQAAIQGIKASSGPTPTPLTPIQQATNATIDAYFDLQKGNSYQVWRECMAKIGMAYLSSQPADGKIEGIFSDSPMINSFYNLFEGDPNHPDSLPQDPNEINSQIVTDQLNNYASILGISPWPPQQPSGVPMPPPPQFVGGNAFTDAVAAVKDVKKNLNDNNAEDLAYQLTARLAVDNYYAPPEHTQQLYFAYMDANLSWIVPGQNVDANAVGDFIWNAGSDLGLN